MLVFIWLFIRVSIFHKISVRKVISMELEKVLSGRQMMPKFTSTTSISLHYAFAKKKEEKKGLMQHFLAFSPQEEWVCSQGHCGVESCDKKVHSTHLLKPNVTLKIVLQVSLASDGVTQKCSTT